jgi:HD superfamily phosphohydrolase
VVTRAEQEAAVLAEYQAAIEAFVDKAMVTYHPELDDTLRFAPKELNDPVWGTIQLTPAEVIVLDSPVIQRLRTVRQLGVVHLVFPGAGHSRFEHSIGVLHQASVLVQALRTAATAAGHAPKISQELEQLLRLAAMCHDIGHGLMSHVSENGLAGDPGVNRLGRAFANSYRVEEPHLSEMAAFFMIKSPSFANLIRFAWTKAGLPPPAIDPPDFMSKAVIGQQIDEDLPLLHEIITGPFDADKLDYLGRDAMYSGTPNVVDILRLTRKIRVVPVHWRELPEDIAPRVQERPNPYLISGIAQSGARTLDELALARALLHDKVYRHQKVRAIETMVASILTILGSHLGPPELLPLRFSDEEFLNLDQDRLASLLEGGLPEPKMAVAVDLIARLRRRDLFVRSFAWEHSPQSVGLAPEHVQKVALQSLRTALTRRGDRGGVASAIADAVLEILEALGEEAMLDGLVRERLKNYIWLDPPTTPKGRTLLKRALLITRDGTARRFIDDFPDTDGWSDQYLVNRDVGFVFAPRQLAVPVYLAAEIVLRTRFDVRVLAEDRASNDGIETGQVALMRRRLYDVGYYGALPTDLWPMPAELTTAAAGQAIQRFLTEAGEYSPPHIVGNDDVPVEALTPRAVREFARQIASADHFAEMIEMLEGMRFFRRADQVGALAAFLSENDQFRGSYVCPVGTAKDSGGIIGYFANDVAATYDLTVLNIHELPADADRVLLIDDFIGSGRQSVDVLEAWLGLERTYALGEDRSFTELPVSVATALRRAEVGFSFCAGLSEGPPVLQEWLDGQSISGTVRVNTPGDALPSLEKLVSMGRVSTELVERLGQAGKEILMSHGVDEDTADARKLGYGNHGLLVAFSHNVPAHSVTALWDRGEAFGREWLPLLPRRRKV